MIYPYECEFTRYLSLAIPEVQELMYAEKESVLLMTTPILKFPAVYFSRESEPREFNKVYKILGEDGNEIRMVANMYNYTGIILVEDHDTAVEWASKLRFYWHDNPYLYINMFPDQEPTKIGLRLKYIKKEELRNQSDKIGAVHSIQFGWQSQLCVVDGIEEKRPIKLVKEVRVYVTTDNSRIMNEGNLYKVIK